jgi:hypothetical protein
MYRPALNASSRFFVIQAGLESAAGWDAIGLAPSFFFRGWPLTTSN